MAFKDSSTQIQCEKFKKEESLKRGRLNFKDGEDVKCVLHKFPFLESSETSKIIPKSKFLFLFILHKFIIYLYLHHIT